MIKLTEEQRDDIVASCLLDMSKHHIKQVAEQYDITPRYIYKLLKQNKENEIDNITDNTNEFTKKANKIMKLALERIEQEILTGEKITLQQLSTTLGILYDKSRLENNKSTENKEIKINIKIE